MGRHVLLKDKKNKIKVFFQGRNASSSQLVAWIYYVIPLLVAVFVFFASNYHWLRAPDNFIFDTLLPVKKVTPAEDIVIVEIDQQSIDTFGRWPWPRSIHSELIDQLTQADVVFFDVIFAEKNIQDPQGDKKLVNSVKNHGRVVLPIHMELLRNKGQLIEVPPMQSLYYVAAGLGHVHVNCDDKGICRSFFLRQGVGEAYWPHVSVELLNVLGQSSLHTEESQQNFLAQTETVSEADDVATDKKQESLNANSFMLLHRKAERFFPFLRASDAYVNISYEDVVRGVYPLDFFEGKVVFVGATAIGLGDYLATSQGLFPGVVLNAIAFDGMRQDKLIREEHSVFLAFLSALFTFLVALILGRLSPFRFIVSVLLVNVFLFLFSYLALNVFNVWLMISPIIIGLLVYYPIWNWFKLQMALTFLKRSLYAFENDTSRRDIAPIFSSNFSGSMDAVISEDSVEIVTNTIARLEFAIKQAEFSQRVVSQSLANLQDAVVILDTEARPVLANDLARHWFDCNLNSMLGKHDRSFVSFFEDKNAELMESAIQRVVDGGTIESFSFQMLHKSGAIRYVLANINKIELFDTSESGAITKAGKNFIISVFTDVTAIKMAEQSKLDTLNFLSHDLRSPMVSVLAVIDMHQHKQKQQTELLSGRAADVENEEVFERIRGYVKKNLYYSESLLQLSRAEALAVESFGLIDLQAVIDNALYQVAAIAEKRSIPIHIEHCDCDMWVHGNTDLLERSFVNLLSNAIKYSHDHGDVWFSICVKDNNVEVLIKDSGVGMREEFLQKIFSRFSRSGDDPSKRGIGLGLFFVKTVLEKHCGSIHVTSCLGEGSSFLVVLPCVNMDADDAV